MPYIGNPIYQSAFVTDTFSGDGTTTAFTMAVAPAGTTNVLVVVSGVVQDPSTYGVVGNTITFSQAPPTGTANISCRYLGVPVTGVTTTAYRTVTEFTATAGQTTFTPPSYNVGFINVYLNGVLLGSADYTATNGTTVVLATGASAGNLVTVESFRIESVANAIANAAGAVSASNLATGAVTATKMAASSVDLASTTITGILPIANGGTGVGGSIYLIDYLIVAGGGNGGAGNAGAGGGAGGVLYGNTTVTSGVAFTVTIGAGGGGNNSSIQNNGGNSSAFGYTAIGGGAGGTNSTGVANGLTGGSGGGGGGDGGSTGYSVAGAGTDGQGNRGGRGWITSGANIGAGGGGAGQSGQAVDNNNNRAGDGGAGFLCSITGTSKTYGGGGGGATQGGSNPGFGATGSGGNGEGSSAATNGVANTGGGGGGAVTSGGNISGSGGSGVVIVRYFGAQRATGGTVTSSSGYTIHTFTTSGTYTA